MFRRLVRANAGGSTVGVDLSPNMAARTQRTARHKFPGAVTHCQAVDARQMPFRNESFDAIVLLLPAGAAVGRRHREHAGRNCGGCCATAGT
jgi:tRNA G10  N-methylase Trm11